MLIISSMNEISAISGGENKDNVIEKSDIEKHAYTLDQVGDQWGYWLEQLA